MTFKEVFLAALRGGRGYDALLELARRQQTQEQSPGETYRTLQELWTEFGFDTRDEDSALQKHLEAVMERVWYETPA